LFEEVKKGGSDNSLSSMISLFTEDWPGSLHNPRYDNKNVQELLVESGISCPKMESLLVTYFSYFIHCKFIEPPPRVPSDDLHINWKKIGDGVQLLSRTNRA